MSDGEILRITSEECAWEVLQKAISGGVEDEQKLLDFNGWPNFHVGVPHPRLDASISPSMMEAFLELQKTIYRAHSFIQNDTGDLRTLSDEEKNHLEFRVKVTGGSSLYDIDLTKILNSLGGEAIAKMSSTDLVIVILGVALIVGGAISFRTWLKHRLEERKISTDSADRSAWLEHYQKQQEHDSQRYKILVEAMSRKPILGEIEAANDSARHHLVRAMSEERGGDVLGVSMSQNLASDAVSQKREQSTEIRLVGDYRVAKVDTTVPDGFRVTLSDDAGAEISASLLDALISEDHRQLIREAEWKKAPIYVELTARRLRNRIVDAKVINVRETIS